MNTIFAILGAILGVFGIIVFATFFVLLVTGELHIIANTKKAICFLWGLFSAIWHYGEV